MADNKRILIVEDDADISMVEEAYLQSAGVETRIVTEGTAVSSILEREHFDLVLLDLMLPGKNGYEVCREIRDTIDIPILMVTARTESVDKIRGLGLGADDYIAKPFSMMEMVARVKALLRRSKFNSYQSDYTIDNLYVCPAKHIVKVDGKEVILTLKEFEMLCLLIKNKGIVLTRDQLLNKIWGYSFDGESRTVDVHIRTLRQKLTTAGNVIKTIRGVGYKISNS